MKKKMVSMLLTCTMLAATLSACGGGSPATSSTETGGASQETETIAAETEGTELDTTAETQAETEVETEEASAFGNAGADRTITVSVQTGEGVREGWEAVAKSYTELNPDVKVVIDLKPVEGYGDWVQKVFTSEEATADIININLAGSTANNKAIDYYEYAEMDSPYSDGIWIDQFDFDKQKPEKEEWDALSLESVQVIWLYNKEIFDEVGVEPPTTWDELIDVCDKIQAAGYQPISIPGDFNSFWAEKMGWLSQIYADQTTRSMINEFRAQEGDYCYEPEKDGVWTYDPTDPYNDDAAQVTQNPIRAFKAIQDGTFAPDSEGMKTVWENFAKVFPTYCGGDAFFGTKDGIPLFYQGKAAITIDGAWRIINFKNDMAKLASGEDVTSGESVIQGVKEFELGTFNMPSMEGAGIEAPARTIEVANGFLGCKSKDQAHNDLVVDFLMYFSSKDGMSTYLQAGLEHGLVPNGTSLVKDVEYPQDIQDAFDSLSFVGNCQKGSGCKIARGMSGVNGDIQESYRLFYDYAYKYLTGEITVDQFLEEHKANILQYLPEALSTSNISENDLENPQNEPTGE